jgi:hypothetical protein
MSKAVAKAKAKANLPSEEVLDLLSMHEGEGLDYETSDLQIPFIRIIQALSPQINKRDPAYIDGASSGDVFNTVTGHHWEGEKGLTVIPCYQETKYLKFTPRESGGGFLGELAKDDPDVVAATRTGSKEILPDGNELVKSDQHYCIVLEDGVPSFGIVDMKSSQLKVSRRWKTQIKMLSVKHPKTGVLVSPPIFGTMWQLTTVEESNDQGTWMNWSVANAGFVEDKEILEAAVNFRKSVMSGEAKAVAQDVAEEQKPGEAVQDAPF